VPVPVGVAAVEIAKEEHRSLRKNRSPVNRVANEWIWTVVIVPRRVDPSRLEAPYR
jgi:hypothetical protein